MARRQMKMNRKQAKALRCFGQLLFDLPGTLFTWEYLEQALTLCFPCVVTWVDIVRGFLLSWLIVASGSRCEFRPEVKKAKRRHKNGFIVQICNTIGRKMDAATNILDKAITWLIGDEPTYKERLSWTSPRFRSQQRVRKDRSRWTRVQQAESRNVGVVQDSRSCLPCDNHRQSRGIPF